MTGGWVEIFDSSGEIRERDRCPLGGAEYFVGKFLLATLPRKLLVYSKKDTNELELKFLFIRDVM